MTLRPEQVVTFGPERGLSGIVTRPAQDVAAARPAVVLLNAGVLSRVGPARLSVQVARKLAGNGHLVLRFDLSGIGDSARRADGADRLETEMADIRAALDHLAEKFHVQRFILLGLCAGADRAVLYAGEDSRVVSVVLLDPNLPHTAGYCRRRLLQRLRSPAAWVRQARRMLRPAPKAAATPAGADDPAAPISPDQPEIRRRLEEAYRRAAAAGGRFLVILTAGLPSRHCYAGQLQDAFPSVDFGPALRALYFADADHNFEAQGARRQLLSTVASWCAEQAA